jgi:hypothetical protein
MAELAKCSRNEMVNLIVEAGLDAILAITPEDALIEIHEGVDSQIHDFVS